MPLVLGLTKNKKDKVNIYDRDTGAKILTISVSNINSNNKVNICFEGDAIVLRDSLFDGDLIKEDDDLFVFGK